MRVPRVLDLSAAIWQAGLKETERLERAAEPQSRRACRQETLERLLTVLTAKERADAVTARLLVLRCEACGRCKSMPPPI